MPKSKNTDKSKQKIFYCYALLDSRKPALRKDDYKYDSKAQFTHEPFYIGQGQRNRSAAHVKIALKKKNNTFVDNSYKSRKIRKILREGFRVIEIRTADNGTQRKAMKREIELIATIGRGSKGPLVNLTSGGEGAVGMTHSKKTKRHISALQQSRSPAEKLEVSLKLKAAHANQSKEAKEARASKTKISRSLRSEAVKRKSLRKFQRTLKSDPAYMQKLLVKRAETYKAKSKADLAKQYAKISEGHARRTPEEQKALSNKHSLAQLNKSPKEKAAALAKFRATMARKPPEEIAATKAKWLKSRLG